jgi:HD superfamily phosphohydrolase YqeK
MCSENVLGDADNQQGSRSVMTTGLTPQRLHAELLAGTLARTPGCEDEDIVHALWRHGEHHEQGSRTGRCGWITSF